MTTYRQAEVGARFRGVAERPEPIPERVLWKYWKKRAALQEGLRTEAGRSVRVLCLRRTGLPLRAFGDRGVGLGAGGR